LEDFTIGEREVKHGIIRQAWLKESQDNDKEIVTSFSLVDHGFLDFLWNSFLSFVPSSSTTTNNTTL